MLVSKFLHTLCRKSIFLWHETKFPYAMITGAKKLKKLVNATNEQANTFWHQ